jgi:hypothetical protein
MRSIVARGVNFGMAVAYMISAEQCMIETVAGIDIPHLDICLNTPYFLHLWSFMEFNLRRYWYKVYNTSISMVQRFIMIV